jgi:hypothetical protein
VTPCGPADRLDGPPDRLAAIVYLRPLDVGRLERSWTVAVHECVSSVEVAPLPHAAISSGRISRCSGYRLASMAAIAVGH